MTIRHHLRLQYREVLSPRATSPNSTTSSSCASNNNGGGRGGGAVPSPRPLTPKSIDGNLFPTTFIHADTSSFKQVVQILTGSAETAAMHDGAAPKNPLPPPPLPPASKVPTGPKKQPFKLYERRGSLKNLKMIGHMMPALLGPNSAAAAAGSSPRRHQADILSPSVLDFPSLALSPVTPLVLDLFNRTPPSRPDSAAAGSVEDRAATEKGFFVKPSPTTTMPREAEPPRLLPLFPLTSPRMSSVSAAGSPA